MMPHFKLASKKTTIRSLNLYRILDYRWIAILIGVLTCGHFEAGPWPLANRVMAQQIGISTPLTSTRDSYYERLGVNFGFSLPGGRGPGSRIVGLMPNGQFTPNGNLIFRQGGGASAIPQFGGYDPAANARFGFNYLKPGGGGFSLGLDFGQGSTRSMTTTTPSLVVQNGHGGSISSGAYRPFVTGIIPVNGNGLQRPQPYFTDNAVTRAIKSRANLTTPSQKQEYTETRRTYSNPVSSAQTGDVSVAAIKAEKIKQLEERTRQYQGHINQVAIAKANGDYRVARIYLRKAIKLSDNESQKERLRSDLNKIRNK